MTIYWVVSSDAVYKLAFITQLSEEFDFENPSLSPQFHYTGPFYDGMHCEALGITITAAGTKDDQVSVAFIIFEW